MSNEYPEFDWRDFEEDLPIPKIFHSLEAGGPFARCLICDRSLLTDDVEYSIEIVFKQREPIIEMAVCHGCRGDLSNEISQDSMDQIRQYVDSKADHLAAAHLNSRKGVDAWLDECALTGVRRADCSEWQICGVFRGDKLQSGFPPLMISGLAATEISERLSEKTRGWMDEFVGDRFGMPPEFCDAPDWSPLML